MKLVIAFLFALSITETSWGQVSPPIIADGQTITEDNVLFVTHPYFYWDRYETAATGIDKQVLAHKKSGYPVIYVLDSLNINDDMMYLKDKSPDALLISETGGLDNPLRGQHFTITGGNWRYCLGYTLGSILKNAVVFPIEINVVADAVYVFLNPLNLKDYLQSLGTIERSDEIRNEFVSVRDYWDKSVCLQIIYDGKVIYHEQGPCRRAVLRLF